MPADPAPTRRSRWGRSVGGQLALSIGGCVVAIVLIMVSSGYASFGRERRRVADELHQVAGSMSSSLSEVDGTVVSTVSQLGSSVLLNTMEPSSCEAAVGAAVSDAGHLHLYDLSGNEVCSVSAPGAPVPQLPRGTWFADVLATQDAVTRSYVEAASGRLAKIVAVPVVSENQLRGVVAVGIYADAGWLGLPPGVRTDTSVFILDPTRTRVLGSSLREEVAGRAVTGRLLSPLPVGGTLVTDPLGHKVFAAEERIEGGMVAIAALPRSAALAGAETELRGTVGTGLIAVAVVIGAALLLHRRLARPVAQLTKAVAAAGLDEETWAVPEGPTELRDLADTFNEMLAERRSRESELLYRAAHDSLTGLPNRIALRAALTEALATRPTTVLFLDLDHFKLVNDSHGHAVGDAVLVALAGRLMASAGPNGVVARQGGDEFVVLSDGDDREGAMAMAREITRCLADPFYVQGYQLLLTGSVGVSIGQPGDDPAELLRDADTAMYRAKENGRPGYALFDGFMRERSAHRLAVEQDLRLALGRDELTLHYQPVVSLGTGTVAGVEALLRWKHPTRGMVPADKFISVAEESGLIIPIGEWVLHEACRQAAAWRKEMGRSVPVSVNISPRQLMSEGLAELVERALHETGARADELVLEITEHGVLGDLEHAFRQIQRLRALGVRVSLDDFGTGWSSISHLQQLPVDELKIDRSFTSRLGDGGRSAPIIRALVMMAHSMGMTVVAEGVETAEQRAQLRRIGCDNAQGWYFARPVPASELRLVPDESILSA